MVLLPGVAGIALCRRRTVLRRVQPAMPVGGHLGCLDQPVIPDISPRRLAGARLALFIVPVAEIVGAPQPPFELEKWSRCEIHGVATLLYPGQVIEMNHPIPFRETVTAI